MNRNLIGLLIFFVPILIGAENQSAHKELPSIDALMEAKAVALEKELAEQELLLAEANIKLAQLRTLEKQVFSTDAYLKLAIFNSAPANIYRLIKTEVLIDGKTVSKGGPKNQGLPRNNQEIFFGPVTPGCHEVAVRASYFKGPKEVNIIFNQTITAKNNYRIELNFEAYETIHTPLNPIKSLEFRVVRAALPNSLPSAKLLSMDSVLKEGQVYIDFATEDDTTPLVLLDKSFGIDGQPILSTEKIFFAPLAEGRHKLNATLFFGTKRRVGGGAVYKFKFNFDREFSVLSGKTTIININGLPKNGFKNGLGDARLARVDSRVISSDNPEFFPFSSCKAKLGD